MVEAYFLAAIAPKGSILVHAAWKNVMRRTVDVKVKLSKLFKNLIVANGVLQVRQVRPVGFRFQPFREFTYIGSIIIFFDMLARTGNGHAVQHFKEVEVQHFEKLIGGAFGWFPFAPHIKCFLRIAEYIIDGVRGF